MTKTADKLVARDADGRYFIEILFEDKDILIVNKPAGLLTIPDHWNKDKTCLKSVLNLYVQKQDANNKIFVVHRLDKDTSGVMVFAKNSFVHKNLSLQFENRETTKIYHAFVIGTPYPPEGMIDAPISKKMQKGGQKFIDHKVGLPAQTNYRTLKKFRDFSLLEARPLTGRMHQIRVHLSHIGTPLAVDPVYSGPEKNGIKIKDIKKRAFVKNNYGDEKTKFIIDRLTLHAAELTFLHPVNGEKSTYSAPPPKDFASLLKQLEKWNS